MVIFIMVWVLTHLEEFHTHTRLQPEDVNVPAPEDVEEIADMVVDIYELRAKVETKQMLLDETEEIVKK